MIRHQRLLGFQLPMNILPYISSEYLSLLERSLKSRLLPQKRRNRIIRMNGERTKRFGLLKEHHGYVEHSRNCSACWTINTVSEMAEAAKEVAPFEQFVDLNDERFTNPQNMIEEIRAYCMETNQKVPETVGELTMCVLESCIIVCLRIRTPGTTRGTFL